MLAVAKHSIALFDLLDKRAKREKIDEGFWKIYRGSITKLWSEIGASNSYYSRVMRSLEDMGSIVILQRGAVGVESVIAVLRKPSPEEFAPQDLTKAEAPATLRQELENVKRNIGGIDIADALKSLHDRLVILEAGGTVGNGKTQDKSKSN